MAEYIKRESVLMKLMQDGCSAKNLQSISDMPPADVAPVIHAHWIRYPDCGVTKCSNCGWSIEECWDSDYCPHCGAQMDEKEDKHEDYT